MKNKKITRSLIIIFSVVALAATALVQFASPPNFSREKKIAYADFYKAAEEKAVLTATIKTNCIEFTKVGSDDIFWTENPDSPSLKEHLLLNGVTVKVEKSAEELISIVLDSLFYIIFF